MREFQRIKKHTRGEWTRMFYINMHRFGLCIFVHIYIFNNSPLISIFFAYYVRYVWYMSVLLRHFLLLTNKKHKYEKRKTEKQEETEKVGVFGQNLGHILMLMSRNIVSSFLCKLKCGICAFVWEEIKSFWWELFVWKIFLYKEICTEHI